MNGLRTTPASVGAPSGTTSALPFHAQLWSQVSLYIFSGFVARPACLEQQPPGGQGQWHSGHPQARASRPLVSDYNFMEG